jgi:integral membrane protein (TIGR01906 family)
MKTQSASKTKYIEIVILILFSLAIFLVIILGSLNMMIFNKQFYYNEHQRNEVDKFLPQNLDSKNMTDNVLKYFRNSEELQYFEPLERQHMQDVKNIIITMQGIYYGAALLSIILFYFCYRLFKNDKHGFIKMLSRALIFSSIASLVFLIGIFLATVFDFSHLFTIFHQIFFPQGNWNFNPTSTLIILFPSDFFFDIILRIFIYATIQSLIFLGIGYWMYKQLKISESYRI